MIVYHFVYMFTYGYVVSITSMYMCAFTFMYICRYVCVVAIMHVSIFSNPHECIDVCGHVTLFTFLLLFVRWYHLSMADSLYVYMSHIVILFDKYVILVLIIVIASSFHTIPGVYLGMQIQICFVNMFVCNFRDTIRL